MAKVLMIYITFCKHGKNPMGSAITAGQMIPGVQQIRTYGNWEEAREIVRVINRQIGRQATASGPYEPGGGRTLRIVVETGVEDAPMVRSRVLEICNKLQR